MSLQPLGRVNRVSAFFPWADTDPVAKVHFIMLDPKQFDDLVQRLSSAMPKGFQVLHEDINRNLKTSLEAGLARLDLVTREEFDVQSAVLARTREKLAALEAQVAELERAHTTRAASD